MINLQFQIDEVVLKEDLESRPEVADSGAIQETYFVMPVSFAVDDIDLFESANPSRVIIADPSGRTKVLPSDRRSQLCLPLLHLASVGYDLIRRLNETGNARYTVPGDGHLDFELSGSDVLIRSSTTETVIKASYQELLKAFDVFRINVRAFLNERVPLLRSHSHWGAWLSRTTGE